MSGRNTPTVKPKQAGRFRPKRKKKSSSPSPPPKNEDEAINESKNDSPNADNNSNNSSNNNSPLHGSSPLPIGTQSTSQQHTKPTARRGKGMPRGKVVMGAMTAAEVKESERKMGFAEKQLKGRRGAKGSTRYEDDEADEEIIGKIEAAPAAAATAKKGNVFSSDDSSDDSSGLEEEDQKPATKKVVHRKTPLKKDMTYEFDPDDDRDDASVPGEEGTVEVDPIQLPLTGKPTDFDKDSESDEEEPVFLSRATSTDKEMKAEAGRLFLFKLPTRLPSLESQGVETQNLGDAALDIAAITGAANPSASSDADADPGRPRPDDRRLFDESLSKMSGQLGRIDVYEDGSAELVITGADGRETRMDVDHGIECGFKQTAVWIDAGERGYREVGDIDKGIVVTPQLE